MTRTPMLIMLAAAAALAGCNKENHTIVAGGEPAIDSQRAANANVQLPPSIPATKLYRCADNSVVSVDYLSDNKSANVRAGKEAHRPRSLRPNRQANDRRGGYSVEGSPTLECEDRGAGPSGADLQRLTLA